MIRFLQSWEYRITESLSVRLPKPLHRYVCPHCRGMLRYLREREASPQVPVFRDYGDDDGPYQVTMSTEPPRPPYRLPGGAA